MGAYTRRAIIVVRLVHRPVANALAGRIDQVGGHLTFGAALSRTGRPPVTHYWCSWQMRPGEYGEVVDWLGADTTSRPGRVFDGDVYSAEQVLVAMGLKRMKMRIM